MVRREQARDVLSSTSTFSTRKLNSTLESGEMAEFEFGKDSSFRIKSAPIEVFAVSNKCKKTCIAVFSTLLKPLEFDK